MSYIKQFFIYLFGYYQSYMLWSVIFAVLFITIVLFFVFHKVEKYKKFKTFEFYDVVWKWEWKGKNIISLWCYCPVCQSPLMCDDEHCRSNSMLSNKTAYFICKACGDIEKGRVIGGDRNYVSKIVKREIMKKIAQDFTGVKQ